MSELRFGTATRDITPPSSVWLAGYGNRYKKSTGALEPLSIGCLALENSGKRTLIITCDLLGLQDAFCEELYGIIKNRTGVDSRDILISCSHTHFAGATYPVEVPAPAPLGDSNAPPTPVEQTRQAKVEDIGFAEPDPFFVADIKSKIAELAEESLNSLAPGTLDFVKLDVPQITYNRRTRTADGKVETNVLYPENSEKYEFRPFDSELTVIRVSNDEGVKAALVNYGCHPVTGGYDRDSAHYKISSDYPYYLRRVVGEEYHCPVFFTLGAAGDTVPVNRFGDSREQIGGVLGNSVLMAERLYRSSESQSIASETLKLEVETIVETSESAESDYERARKKIVSLLESPDNDLAASEYSEAYAEFNRSAHLACRHRLYPDDKYAIKIQFHKIGDLTLVGMPFEVLSEISLRIKAEIPNCVIVSCAGGYQGYLPLEHEFARGGYEANESSAHFKEDTADRLVEMITDKLKIRSAE